MPQVVVQGRQRKVACEPCIRGHRSSKCDHTDRIMLDVRKPGRPLSQCPHPPGATCSCQRLQHEPERRPRPVQFASIRTSRAMERSPSAGRTPKSRRMSSDTSRPCQGQGSRHSQENASDQGKSSLPNSTTELVENSSQAYPSHPYLPLSTGLENRVQANPPGQRMYLQQNSHQITDYHSLPSSIHPSFYPSPSFSSHSEYAQPPGDFGGHETFLCHSMPFYQSISDFQFPHAVNPASFPQHSSSSHAFPFQAQPHPPVEFVPTPSSSTSQQPDPFTWSPLPGTPTEEARSNPYHQTH